MEKTTTSTSFLSPFNGKTIVLELDREITFKAKQELINYLREQQAHISYILTASTDYVLSTNNVDSYKIRRAKQLGLPVIDVKYVYEYRSLLPGQSLIDIDKFIIKSIADQESFTKTGTISIAGSRTNVTKIDLTKIKLWNSDDADLPHFDESTHCEIGKWAIFKETNDNSNVFFVLELQVIPEQHYDRTTSDYRSRFRYEKQQGDKKVLIQYAFSDDLNEQQQLFASYYNRVATMPRITRIREMLPDKLGSKLLLRSLFTHRIDTQILDDNVCQLIESIWLESIGDLNKILSISPESITLKTIIEAEAALLELKSTNDPAAARRFYSLIPHRPQYNIDLIKNRRILIDKIDLCQMLRDMLTVNELTNWNVKAPIEAKYRALKCYIKTIDSSTLEYKNIINLIQSSTNSDEQIIVHNIFSVVKQTDALNFCTRLSNQRRLFHGSKYSNFLGILSRGLIMPKMVVEELGIVRTDIGCLGYGIYFSDSISTSLKYTTASTIRSGRRLLCISQVALGESANYYSFSPNLIKPPNGFHSTHGVKRTEDNHSMFTDNEYTIYQLNQQRLLYIVEISWKPYDILNIELERLPIVHHQQQQHALKLNEHGNVLDEIPMIIDDEIIEITEQDYGLICPSSKKLIPLKSFHIRAQIIDTTVEVILYQVYLNTSSKPIEAKYVFPLDENSTVCGFEAHINNKIIKGIVKEKEQAKKEYREAIEKGHGAYLMHQEQAQIFSVAVGNLPANNEVIIKITYVAELEIENGDIIFRFPAKMTSWQSKQAIDTKDQSIVQSIGIIHEKVEFSLKASIRMPFEITKLFSPTHRIRRKLTECIAMIELIDNVLIDRDFILSITLNNPNLPRISNETMLSNHSQACMLTFYPKFEILTNTNEQIEIIFIVDVSNSMDGIYVQQAKQLTHLFLTNMKINDGNTYFNLITFGSDNDECFPISVPTTKENLDKAKHFVLHSLVHRGNTDLFSILHRYSLLPSKFTRQFILLSDGHIGDLNAIISLLEHRSALRRDRLFTCSIGDIANKHTLKQLANGANGGGLTTIFDSNYRSKWKTKVLSILEHVRQPCVTNISIDWHGNVDKEQKFNMQAPKIIRSLFNGMRLTAYRFIQNCHKATLTATINGQEFVTTVFSSMMTTTTGRILHCLTTRAIIDDYDNGILHIDESENELMKVQYKRDLIDLSIKHSVVSVYTSFVAIEERDDKQTLPTGVRLLDVMMDRDVDLLPYIGWDGDVSNLTMIKQKLIDARISLESASIQNTKELIIDSETLCEKISYLAGGDSKFDMMMTIIRTYRHLLNQYDKADQLEEKMRNDINTEMINATTEERQTLQQRCEINNLIIKDDETEESIDEDILNILGANFHELTQEEQIKSVTSLFASLGPKPEPDELLSMTQTVASISSKRSKSITTTGNTGQKKDVLEKPLELPLKSQESEDEQDEVDLSFLDCMAESSYKEFARLVGELQSKANDLKPESLEIYHSFAHRDTSSVQFTDTDESSSSTSHSSLNWKILREAKQMLLGPDEYKPEIIEPKPSVEIYQVESSSSHISGFTDNKLSSIHDDIVDNSQPTPVNFRSPTISLSKAATSLASHSGGSCMGSSIQSQPKSSIKQSAFGGEHGRIRVATNELKISNDDTLNQTQLIDSAFVSTDQDVEYDEQSDDDLKSMKHKKKKKLKRSEHIQMFDTPINNLLLLDVCPLSLGIEDIHGYMHTLIRRNTTIPTRTQFYSVFTNAYAYQTTAIIRIFEGEHYLTKYNNFLGEFSLDGLTSNFTDKKLEIGIRMDIDCNGILHVDAEETHSGATASFTVEPNQSRLTKDDIEQHITNVRSNENFVAKSVYDRKPDDPLYLLDGQTESIIQNFSGEFVSSFDKMTDIPRLGKLKDIQSTTTTMIEELLKLQSENGSFILNKDLANVFHINVDIFNNLEHYLYKQGFNSLAKNVQNEILHLISTGVILIWLVFQTQILQQKTIEILFNIEQFKIHLYNNLTVKMIEQINKSIEFYQRTSQRNNIYCKQLELIDSSWDMFIQRIFNN